MAGGLVMKAHVIVLVTLFTLISICITCVSDEMILQAPGIEEQITSGSGNDVTPRIDGNYITWVQWVYGDADVYYYSIDGKLEQRVTTANGNSVNPDVSGNYIVWEDDRSGKSNIWVYDISTMTEARISNQGSYQRNPAISGHNIVWEDYRNTMDPDIYMYVIGQGQEYPVCIQPGRQINPDISGNYIVWEDYRYSTSQNSENSDIFMYDIDQGVEVQVTRDLSAQKNPRIDGNIIVWEDWRNANVDIYMAEINTLAETPVTFGLTDDTEPDISGNIVTWTHSDSQGKKDLYKINLQDTRTNSVCAGPGDQTHSSISIDKVVWQDDRNGINNNDIYLYTLQEETPYPPYQFSGNCYINGINAPVGTDIIAMVSGTEVGRTTTQVEGQYGNGGYERQLIVQIDQSMLGKEITFWTGELRARETVLVTADGGVYPLDLTFTYTQPIAPCEFYGTITIDGVPAFPGTGITAIIDNQVRGQFTTREVGMYGGPGSAEPRLVVPIYSEDVGKTITFWIDGIRADTTFFIEEGGIFMLDLVFTQSPFVPDYQFYGYTTIHNIPAPAGTVISALVDGQERGRITTVVEGAYGGPYTGDDRLVVPLTVSDLGKTIFFWSGGMIADEREVIAGDIPATEDSYIVIRKDLNFKESTGIIANFVGEPTTGQPPLTVLFTDLSTGSPTMWHWDFGDGGTNDELGNPVHTYAQEGVYSVLLTASNQYGESDQEVKPDYISVGSVPSKPYISLYPGWNCVATPRWLADGYNTAAIFNGVDVNGHSIYQYDAENGIFKTLQMDSPVLPLDSIWIYSAKMDMVYLTFDSVTGLLPEKNLYRGWNSVGFTGLEPVAARITFASVADSWVYCLIYDAIEQTYRETVVKDHNDTTALTPYQGCWLFMNEDGVLTGLSG